MYDSEMPNILPTTGSESCYYSCLVYVTPSANGKDAMNELCSGISELQTIHPDTFYLMTGDFNKAGLKSVLT